MSSGSEIFYSAERGAKRYFIAPIKRLRNWSVLELRAFNVSWLWFEYFHMIILACYIILAYYIVDMMVELNAHLVSYDDKIVAEYKCIPTTAL